MGTHAKELIFASEGSENRTLPLLYVDDNPDDHILFHKAWQNARVPFSWKGATTVAEAMEYLRELIEKSKRQIVRWPKLIVTDIALPFTNGFELVKFVRQTAEISHIPIVLLSGAFSPADEENGKRVGANLCVVKPFELSDLVDLAKDLHQLATRKCEQKEEVLLESLGNTCTPDRAISDFGLR